MTGDPGDRTSPRPTSSARISQCRWACARFTRLTNGFSKKLENHVAANALYFLHYNFARIHQTLRITLAMAAGIADHVWGLEEIVALLGTRVKLAA
jgi:hypothetical protein